MTDYPTTGEGDDLSSAPTNDEPETPAENLMPRASSRLERFSILHATDELEAMAQRQTPLLGGICLATQATVLYAKPNTGKTLVGLHLLREAVGTGRIDGNRCYYVAADDNPAGVLEKQKALKPYGVHVLVPGLRQFSAAKLSTEIEEMIRTGTAEGSFVILDTLKKFADLMDKKSSSAFADLARRYIIAGGTLLVMAHTNKRTDSSGRPIYAGTSDIVDDFDCAYTIMELPQGNLRDERVVQFDNIKKRGRVVEQVAYRYSLNDRLTYEELLDSVREIDGDDLDRVRGEADQETDADGIAATEDCIRDGIRSKQDLKKEASRRSRIGQHKISLLIDKYTGDDPLRHRWQYDSFGRGRREYRLLTPGESGPRNDPDAVF